MTLFRMEQTDWMQIRLGESPSQLVTKRVQATDQSVREVHQSRCRKMEEM